MKILIVEGRKLIQELLSLAFLTAFPDAETAAAGSWAEGWAKFQAFTPDLVLLEMLLPDRDGLEMVPEIRAASPATKIIGLSQITDEFLLSQVALARLDGFVDKSEQTLEMLCAAVQSVRKGVPFYSPAAKRVWARLDADPIAFTKVLSPREVQMLRFFGDGLDNETIGAQLGLSAGTVRIHRQNIMGKLNLRSTPQLMRYALEKGFTRSK